MRIDYSELNEMSFRIKSLLNTLESCKEKLDSTAELLRENSMLEEEAQRLKGISQTINCHIVTAVKTKLVVEKTIDVYSAGERRIATLLEGEPRKKHGFSDVTFIKDHSDFTWRIK